MKQLLCLLAVLFPLTLFGQAVSRTELRNTNTLIDARMTSRVNTASNAIISIIGTNRYNVARFGILPDGTDQSFKVLQLISNVMSRGGGVIEFNAGSYLITNKITFTNDGANPPRQNSLRITGMGAWKSGQPIGLIDGGTVLELRNTNSVAKIDTRGLGLLEIDHLTLANLGGDGGTPFIQTTLTTLSIHDCAFIGKNAAPNADEDAIVLGGTNITYTGAADNAFQGYGTVIENNYFNKIRRGAYMRTYCNGTVFRDNTFWNQCGGIAAVELLGDHNNGTTGNLISGNLIEVGQYTNVFRLTRAPLNVFSFNNLFDAVAGFPLSTLEIISDSSYNFLLEGYGTDTSPPVLNDDGTTMVLTPHASKTNFIHNTYRFIQSPVVLNQTGPYHIFGTNSIYAQILAGDYTVQWQGAGMSAESLISLVRASATDKRLDIKGTGTSWLRSPSSELKIAAASGQALWLGDISSQAFFILNGILYGSTVGTPIKLANGGGITWSETSSPGGQAGVTLVFTNGAWRLFSDVANLTNVFQVSTNGEVTMPHTGSNGAPMAAAVFDSGGKLQRGALVPAGTGGGSSITPFVRLPFTTTNIAVGSDTNVMWATSTHNSFSVTNVCNGCKVTHTTTNDNILNYSWFNATGSTNHIEWQNETPPTIASPATDIGTYTVYLIGTPTNILGWYYPPLGTARLVIGGLENRGTTTNAGAVNNAGAVTNYAGEVGIAQFAGQPSTYGFGSSNANGNFFTFQSGLISSNMTVLLPTNTPVGLTRPVMVLSNLVYGASGTSTGQLCWVEGATIGATVIASAMIQTNFVLNQIYTNDTGSALFVRASAIALITGVAGTASLDLMVSPAGGTSWSNASRFSVSSLLTSLAATNSGEVSAIITNTGSYYFTNSSVGTGDSASLAIGTGQRTILGGGTTFTNFNLSVLTNVNIFAAASVVTCDATTARSHIQTNRMTAAQTLVHTNFATGQFGTEVIPGEIAGGTARVLTYAVVAGSLIRTNDSAFIASSGFGISIPAGYQLEISSMQKSFLNTNVVDLKLSYQPQ